MDLKKRVGLFPGTFDPPTVGHEEIIRQAVKLFDQLFIGVATNPEKEPLLSLEARLSLLRELAGGLSHVEVVSFGGLTSRFAREKGIGFLVRGLRNERDLAYERELAAANEELFPGLVTVFLLARRKNAFVSSRLVREIVAVGGPEAAKPFIPEKIWSSFLGKLSSQSG